MQNLHSKIGKYHFYTKRKKSNQTITLLAGGRGWARALLESLLAAQAVAFILCGSHPPRTLFYTKRKKSNQTITLLAGGDEDDKSETVLSSDNLRLLALSLKLK